MPDKQPKIIIVGPAYPLRGGIADFNEAFCRAMLSSGIDARIYSFSLQYPSFLFPGKTQYALDDSPPGGLKITTVINSINPFNWFKVAKQIKQENPDGVIFRFWLPFMGPCLGTIAKLVKKKDSIKVIAITDNVIPHESRPGDKLFTRYFIKQCDGFIAMSHSVLDDLTQFTSNRSKVFLPHPIYDTFGEKLEKAKAREHLRLENQGRYLLFFGFIRKYKGLDLLLNAMADDRIRSMNVKLIVAGEFYEEEESYLQIIRENNLNDNIILKTEFIPKEQVAYYFCAADMIVQPYRTATQSGITQIAYHFERPMLVTNVGGLPEIVPDGKAGYVTSTDSKSIADAIVDFYSEQKETTFCDAIINEKKRFAWSYFVDGVMDLFKSVKR